MPSKVVLFSDIFLPTFPYLEVPLYKYLKAQGIDVKYVLQDGDIRLTDPTISKVFSDITVPVENPKRLSKLMGPKDMLLMRFAYKGIGGEAAQAVRSSGHKVFMYDPSGIDIRVRQCPAHYLTAKSKELKLATLKKFPRAYKNIFTTGTIHYDAAAITQVDKTEFMRSYGMDPNKKLAILTPANPGEAWMEGIQDDYKQIVDIVKNQCPDYELAIKCHPYDYTIQLPPQPGIIHKGQHYGGKSSWEVLAPELPVIKAEEGYMALRAADVILNIRSSIAMETCLFPVPLVNINRSQYVTNWPYADGVMLDIEMVELAAVLNTSAYSVDAAACKTYCKAQCFSDDGKAYERIGNAVIKVLKGEV